MSLQTSAATLLSLTVHHKALAGVGKYPEVQIEIDLSNSWRDLSRDGFALAVRSEVGNDERLARNDLRRHYAVAVLLAASGIG